jgi:hypothetical protein
MQKSLETPLPFVYTKLNGQDEVLYEMFADIVTTPVKKRYSDGRLLKVVLSQRFSKTKEFFVSIYNISTKAKRYPCLDMLKVATELEWIKTEDVTKECKDEATLKYFYSMKTTTSFVNSNKNGFCSVV